MAGKTDVGDGAPSAGGDELASLLESSSEEVLAALLDDPRLDEGQLCRLLERKDLPETLLERIARRKHWMASYRVKRRVAFHPHTPRLEAMRLARELYLMDLVQLSLTPAATPEVRHMAEELVLARLPQLVLGQKTTLARRGSARVAAGLLAEGQPQLVRLALDNAFLTEAQLLKVLAKERLPGTVVLGLAQHRKWSQLSTVRLALLRHPQTPTDRVKEFLRDLTLGDLKALVESSKLPGNVRRSIRDEMVRRTRGATEP